VAQFSLVEMMPPILLAVPNVSEGRDTPTINAIGEAFKRGGGTQGIALEQGPGAGEPASPESPVVRLLDVHSDRDHHRSVFTLAGRQCELADALLRGAQASIQRVDVMSRASNGGADTGQHPHVGAVDVVPLVYLDRQAKGAACAEALVVADRMGVELEVPVFLYGELAGDGPGSARAELRRGGVAGLAERMAPGAEADGARRPDFGPPRMHPTAGATLVAARQPLVAFNLQLQEPATVEDARRIAALIREGGADGLPGVRAIGISLDGHVAQVSMNVERPLEVPLAHVLAAVARHARVASAELVGLAPRAALEGFPEDVPMPGFDPARHVIENALGS
jgi:glutamate formiminotransferase / 5-formyltetrahydrofolate cyclo-ligase